MDEPVFRSLAFRDVPRPDFADVVVVPLPVGATTDPRRWAEAIFDIHTVPKPVLALLGLRQVAVRAIGLDPAPRGVFAVGAVVGEEALIAFDDKHLDFRVGVGVDADARLVRVTTAVRLHGWRGRVYFAPVSQLHPAVVRAMVRAAGRRLVADDHECRPAPRPSTGAPATGRARER